MKINQNRMVTLMFSKSKWFEDMTYTVYLAGEKGSAATPVDKCALTGLAYLNYFNLMEKPEERVEASERKAAIRNIARGLASISGRDDSMAIDEIIKAIADDDGLNLVIKSGILVVHLRPIDTNEIKDYYDAIVEVLRAL